MAEMEKLNDAELEAASGGIKYDIGPTPVYVYDNNANLRHILYQGDFLVTDGTYRMAGPLRYAHVYYHGGDGWVDARVLG